MASQDQKGEIIQCANCDRPVHKSEALSFQEKTWPDGVEVTHHTCGNFCMVKLLVRIGYKDYMEMNALENAR